MQSSKEDKLESSNDIIILEGVFFVRASAIKNKTEIAKEALKDMHEFIGELLDFPKGTHDDTIDAFWLSTQFAKGNKKAGTVKKNNSKGYSKSRKRYNWVTGARY